MSSRRCKSQRHRADIKSLRTSRRQLLWEYVHCFAGDCDRMLDVVQEVWWAVSMHLHIACALLCISLHCALAGTKWEVINDVKPFDDTGTQEDILSQEDLIPYRAKPKPRPKPRPKPAPKAPAAKHADEGRDPQTAFINNAAPRPAPPSRDRSEVEEEELLPLGVPQQRRGQRHLLQLGPPMQGPKLPPHLELKRLMARSGAVNLSTGCKEDCLFDVDDFIARQLQSDVARQQDFQADDFQFVDQEMGHAGPGSQEERGDILLSRHKRQNNNNNNNDTSTDSDNSNSTSTDSDSDSDSDSSSDSSEEGSGYIEELYEQKEEFENQGKYPSKGTLSVTPQNGTANFTDEDLKKYQEEFQKELEKALNESLPGFDKVVVDKPKIINGSVVSNFSVVVDASIAANQHGEDNLEEVFSQLGNASSPIFQKLQNTLQNITIFNQLVDPGVVLLVDELVTAMYDYCGSQEDPCPGVGPEFNKTACQNTGFASGTCPHKCHNNKCQNDAACELDSNYNPYCNCGERYTGEYCETKEETEEEKPLSTGGKVGVGVASTACAAALLGCCLCCLCRRSRKEVNYSYYQDDDPGEEGPSDHTSVGNYLFDRPRVFGHPTFSFFNTQQTVDA